MQHTLMNLLFTFLPSLHGITAPLEITSDTPGLNIVNFLPFSTNKASYLKYCTFMYDSPTFTASPSG